MGLCQCPPQKAVRGEGRAPAFVAGAVCHWACSWVVVSVCI